MDQKRAERILTQYGPEALCDELGPVDARLRAPAPETRIVDGTSTMKCACDKVVKSMDMNRCHSGVVPYLDNICVGCTGQAKGLATVVCATCHRVAGRLPPAKDRYGFKIEANRCYHLERCPSCCPGNFKYGQVGEIARTPIIEMLLYHRRMGVKS